MSRRHDARTLDPAGVDGLAQRHVQQVAARLDEQAEVADSREARAQRATGVATARRLAFGGSCPAPGTRPGSFPRPPMSRLHPISIRPGSRIASPRSRLSMTRIDVATNADDSVGLHLDDARPDDLAAVDVEQTRCFEGQHAQTTGSLISSMYAAPLSSYARLLPDLDGELTMTIDCPDAHQRLASSGIPLSGDARRRRP